MANKNELVAMIAAETGFTKKDVIACVDALVDVVTDTLANGDDVNITGFGKFVVSERSAREGRNPLTGETIQIEAKKCPKFRAGSNLKAAINE